MGMFDTQDNGKSVQDILNELNRGRTQRIQDWMDRGGGSLLLTLVLIIISTYHIIMVLAHRDPLVVAVSVAVVCDWGLFNFVSFLLKERFSKAETPAAAFTVLLAGAAAFYSIMFHLRYYNGDWFLALFTPFSIILLSWTSYRQRRRWDEKQKIEPKPGQQPEQKQNIPEQKQTIKQKQSIQPKPKAGEHKTKIKITDLLLIDQETGEVECPFCGKRARSAKALQGAGHRLRECLDKRGEL